MECLALASLRTADEQFQEAFGMFEPDVRDGIAAMRARLARKGTEHGRFAN